MDNTDRLQMDESDLRAQLLQLQNRVAELERHNLELQAQRHAAGDSLPSELPDELTPAQKYRLLITLVNHLPDFIYAKDINGRFILNNNHSLHGFGLSDQSETLGKTDFDFVPPEFAQNFYTHEEVVLMTGKPLINIEEPYLTPTGEPGWLLTTKVPVKDNQGQVVGLVGVSRDITEQKLAQNATAVSRDTLQRLIQQIPVGIQIFDTHGICLDVNDAHMRIFGIESPDQVVGKFNLFEDETAKQVGTQAAGKKALQGQIVHLPEVQFDFSRSDSRFAAAQGHRTLAVTFFPVRNTTGDVVQIVGLNEDITPRKQAETNYQTLVEQLPAITYVTEFVGRDSRMVYISPQVETLLGFSPSEWLENPQLWLDQIHPADRKSVLAEMERSLAAGEGLNLEYRLQARDGRVLWFRNQTTLLNSNSAPRFAHGILFDITRQKQLEDQLRQVQKMEAVGQMAGGVAHNFNNVLTALIGHAELALDSLPPEHPIRFDLESIKRGAQRAANLTHQLLAFTRNEPVQPQILDLSEMLTSLDDMMHQLIGSSIEVELRPGENLWKVKIDPGQIEQLLVNLTVNARDAMPDGGTLTIETTNISLAAPTAVGHIEIPAGDYVVLAVSDTGTGIPPEIQPRIFEPFFTTKEVGQGTGLGLSSCFGIVQQNKGHITFESVLQQGTTFKVYLPKASQRTKSGTFLKSVQQRVKLEESAETILLVEDSAMIRTMAARVLRRQGYEVLEAADGEEALQLLGRQSGQMPQLLITDLSMPKMDGNLLARQVMDTYPMIKVILISGHTDRTLHKQGILDAGYKILLKPFTPDTLIKTVKELLAG